MQNNSRTYVYGAIVALILVSAVSYFVWRALQSEPIEYIAPEPIVEEEPIKQQVIGTSVEGRAIEAYTFGTGDTNVLFVGGMHGGYEWNSVYLAYRMIDHLEEHPDTIPEEVAVTIIPSLNPDGVYEVVGVEGRFAVEDAPDGVAGTESGRFNANDVDLNRNFDCKWQPESSWRGNTVSAGTGAFSEPEARAFRDFVLKEQPEAVVFWHSQANAVYASECESGILPETLTLMNTYASSAGYDAVDSFDAYEVTGDAEGWLASIGIPAITVELATHMNIEWEKNVKGAEAVFTHYGK